MKMFLLKYFIVLSILSFQIKTINSNSSSSSDEKYIIKTNEGKVQGVEDHSTWSKKSFIGFKGIPYAKPPVGELRFQPPLKHEGWSEIRESKYSPVCPQLNTTHEDVIDGDEDCLYLNVFVPSTALKPDAKKSKLPVLVFIHGGGFQYESGSTYGPNYWMEEDIIYVTFNYRLGILGFLQTSDGAISGNMGLKDQVLALKWVQRNIERFGGDKNQVTLMGVSSGAASVHLHMLSESSQGLFHRAISQSGTALSPWAIVKGDNTVRIAKNTDCTKNTTEEYIACLKELSFVDIVKSQAKLAEWFIDPIVPVGPALEKNNPTAFITSSPYKLITQKKYKPIPWILGVNSEEGLLHANDILKHPMLTHVIQFEWIIAAPITLIYRGASFDLDRVSNTIREFYFKKEKIGRNVYKELINMYSDRYFFHGTHHAAKLHAANANNEEAPTYLYYFDFKGKDVDILAFVSVEGTVEEDGGVDAEKFDKIGEGVSHYDQLQYLFNTPYYPEIEDPEQVKLAHNMRKMFTQFIKTGVVENWEKVSKKAVSGEEPLKYNEIGATPLGVIEESWTERINFWDSLGLMEMGRELDSILDTMNVTTTPDKDEL